jgi:hypothetical protein
LTTERVDRRLASVLAADVAGGIDEEGTLARLKAVRKTSSVELICCSWNA